MPPCLCLPAKELKWHSFCSHVVSHHMHLLPRQKKSLTRTQNVRELKKYKCRFSISKEKHNSEGLAQRTNDFHLFIEHLYIPIQQVTQSLNVTKMLYDDLGQTSLFPAKLPSLKQCDQVLSLLLANLPCHSVRYPIELCISKPKQTLFDLSCFSSCTLATAGRKIYETFCLQRGKPKNTSSVNLSM